MKKLILWFGLCISFSAQAIQVSVTIPPLAMMVTPFLAEEDQITILLKPGASPHGFQLRPSQLVALSQSDLVMTVGSGVDVWADKPLEQMGFSTVKNAKKRIVTMQKLPGLVILSKRNLLFKLTEESHDEPHHEEHDEEHDIHHQDPHTWLSPKNARLMLSTIAKALIEKAPNRKEQIEKELATQLHKLDALHQQLKQQFLPIQKNAYLVLHDAFQYFEKPYGLNNQGAVQLSAQVKPSVKRVLELRALIEQKNIRCVFKEPQFSDKQVKYITQDLSVKIGSLDPIGRVHEYKDYADFQRALADQYLSCLQ